MKLPRNNRELDGLFSQATVPNAVEFDGEFEVDMLTILPSLRRLGHRKVFWSDAGKVIGCNVLFRNFRWGRVVLEPGKCNWDGQPALLINYDVAGNYLSRGMRDYVRRLEKGETYLGRFNYVLFGRLIFLGYFSLRRLAAGKV
ncbi:MAG: hypothetical protein PHT12_00750 [Patescibacteria group bacterium]|nr:hypothetical protein [Patescibacteria group bacterium]